MIKVHPKIIVLNPPTYKEAIQKTIIAARNCYKSFDNSNEDSDIKLIQHLIDLGHSSIMEQAGFQYFDRSNNGVHLEDVRQRTGKSHAVESTRWARYSGKKFGHQITVIDTMFFRENPRAYSIWEDAMLSAEKAYMALMDLGVPAEQAREVLPKSLKTDDVQYANFTGLRTFFNQRCGKQVHPEMRRKTLPFLDWCAKEYPVFFGDIRKKFQIEYDRFETLS